MMTMLLKNSSVVYSARSMQHHSPWNITLKKFLVFCPVLFEGEKWRWFLPQCVFWIKKKEFVIPFLQLWRDCRVLVDFGMCNRTTAMVNALYLSFSFILSLVFPIIISFLVCDMRKRIDLLRKRFNHFPCPLFIISSATLFFSSPVKQKML